MRELLRFPILVAAAAFAASGCWAQSRTGNEATTAAFAPAEVHRLRDFGAVGDGRADDTSAIQRALANSDQYCLDGEGRTFRVNGTLRVQKNLCLRNVTLVQSAAPFDTRPYIRGSCPVTLDATAVVDCGDPAIPPEQLDRLLGSLSVRTLMIRPARSGDTLRVTLDHVKVDRGSYPEGGSRTDFAGIWLEDADRADLRNVEITGSGKGFGLRVGKSRNVTVDNLWIHDIVWAPYPGDAPLTRARVSAIGWNSAPIREFRRAGEGAAKSAKFYGVRVQEQVTCALFSEVHNVVIRNSRISRCMARFQDGDLPWQADGLDISKSSSNVTVAGAAIDSAWEGMDVVANGAGLDGLSISDVHVSNAFGFGLKLGKELRNARVSNVTIRNAGLAGIVIYGPADGVTVSGADISGVGTIAANGGSFVPWTRQTHSGIVIHEGGTGQGNARATPRNVLVESVIVDKSSAADFGILNKGGTNVRVRGFRGNGFRKAAAMGVSPSQ
jgi:hypothetical protein